MTIQLISWVQDSETVWIADPASMWGNILHHNLFFIDTNWPDLTSARRRRPLTILTILPNHCAICQIEAMARLGYQLLSE